MNKTFREIHKRQDEFVARIVIYIGIGIDVLIWSYVALLI